MTPANDPHTPAPPPAPGGADTETAFAAAALQSSDDAIIGLTLDATIRTWNAGAERLYGYAAAEVIGRSFDLLVPEENRADHERRRTEMIRSGQGAAVESVRQRKDGTRVTISTRVSQVRDAAGRAVGLISIARDITAQKRAADALRESERRYRGLVDALPQMVWVVRPDGKLLYVNQGWTDYTGCDREATEEFAWDTLLLAEERDAVWAVWVEATQSQRPYEMEYRLRGSDGRFRWFLMRCVPLPDAGGQVAEWLGTCTDIHDRKQAERAQALLADLAEHARRTADPDAVLWASVTALGAFLGASRCLYGETNVETGLITVHRDYCDGVPSVAGTYTRAGFGDEILRDLLAGRTTTIDDSENDPRTASQFEGVYRRLGIRASLNVPVMSRGRQAATLSVQQSDGPRAWTLAEIALAEAVAERTYLAVESARLEQAAHQETVRQRRFLRDVLASVTGGRLTLCGGHEDLPALGPPSGPPVPLSASGGLRDLRCEALGAARALGLSDAQGDDLITAVGEASMNAVVHVGAGVGQVFTDAARNVVQVRVVDHGPGIALEDLPSATLRKGYTTAGTLGHGMKMMLQTADRVFLLTGASGTVVVIEQDRAAAPEPW